MIEQHYDDMYALLADIKRDTSTRYGSNPAWGQSTSLTGEDWHGVTLKNFLSEISAGRASERIRDIHEAIEGTARLVQEAVPATPLYTRQRVYGTAGTTLHLSKVLRGDNKPWSSRRRQARLDDAGNLIIVVPLGFSARIHGHQLTQTITASVALARVCILQGRTVEIIGMAYSQKTYAVTQGAKHSAQGYLLTISLLQSWEPWGGVRMASITCPEFLRRIIFRHMELQQRETCVLEPGYGHTAQKIAHQQATEAWCADHGCDSATAVLGATQWDNITSQQDAQTWVKRTLARLDTEESSVR